MPTWKGVPGSGRGVRHTLADKIPPIIERIENAPTQNHFHVQAPEGEEFRSYGSWMTAGRAATISDPSVSSGNNIYNPIGVIESIIQDELITNKGFSDLDVNTDSFDVAYDERPASDWAFYLSIHNRITSFEILTTLAFECASKIYFNYNKELSIKAYNSSNSLDYYFMTEPSQEHESLNRGRIIGEPELQPVALDGVYNKIQVNYKWDYGRRVHTSNVYVDSTDSNWSTVTDTTAVANCLAAENNYHIENKPYIYNSIAIQDAETAERLCNHLADRLTKRLYVCRFETGLEGLQMEIGDFINIQSPVINGIWSGTYATKKWEVFSIGFNAQDLTCEISAIEV